MPTRQHAAMPGRTIAFVCAMPMELEPLTRELSLVESEVDGRAFQTGRLADHDVVGLVTGMGTRLAAEGVERLLDAFDVEHLFVVGIAGAGMGDAPIGALVMPEVVIHGPSGREYRPTRLGDHDHDGHMWTSDVLIDDLDELAAMHDERGVVALDMETAAIAHVCETRGVPWSVFRAISDRSSEGLVDAEVFKLSNLDNTPNHDAIAAYFEKHPEAVAKLQKMAADSELAAETAAAAAIAAVGHL
jgi:adenosylhomocysteine nucleosidase